MNDPSHASQSDLAKRVRLNQQRLRAELNPQYDFIVCRLSSAGSVVVRRLAENPNVNVLLLEAGGSDDVDDSSWVQAREAVGDFFSTVWHAFHNSIEISTLPILLEQHIYVFA